MVLLYNGWSSFVTHIKHTLELWILSTNDDVSFPGFEDDCLHLSNATCMSGGQSVIDVSAKYGWFLACAFKFSLKK